jgi:flavin reductase (DIM6/NTAB) family NADH-FMN oxidoreductase RutF
LALTLTTGAPLLAEALVALDCEVEETIERHGSAILIGRISGILSSDSGNALLYWRGGYEALGWTEAEAQRAVDLG